VYTKASPRGILLLEDGRILHGHRFGAETDAIGEVVFNTSMTGYQEILSDPSYAGQIIVMTYPQIGNYGLAREDFESRIPFLSGLLVKEVSRIASNWRHAFTLDDYLKEKGIPGLAGFDTRALVRHIRTHGAMRGIIADAGHNVAVLLERVHSHPSMAGCDLASTVTAGTFFGWSEPGFELPTHRRDENRQLALWSRPPHVVVVDYGVKWNILRRLIDANCRVTVVPAQATASNIQDLKPDGVVLSNGPGDPDPLDYAVENIRNLIGKVPIFGICLGHQLLAIAAGGKTFKLRFGHRGGNHPVIHLQSKAVEITSHNHGFSVDPDSLPTSEVEITHLNLNDQTVEGLSLRNHLAFSVQYHPEAAPGPHDAHHMFAKFASTMLEWRRNK
jgi:carbamoyl-phosphate synthase small subunit